jgi:hypothetical protein
MLEYFIVQDIPYSNSISNIQLSVDINNYIAINLYLKMILKR